MLSVCRLIAISACSVLLVGCMSPAPKLAIGEETYPVSVDQISVVNLTTPSDETEYMVYQSGFGALADSLTIPPFSEYVVQSLQDRLQPATTSLGRSIELLVVDAQLLQESRFADSVAFIGIFSALSPREQKCVIDINFRLHSMNKREKFESLITTPLSFGDLETAEKKQLVEQCVNNLISETASYINSDVVNDLGTGGSTGDL